MNDGEVTLKYITLKSKEVVYVDVILSNLTKEEDKNLMSSSGIEKILCSQTTTKTIIFNSNAQVKADDNIPETFVLKTSPSSYSVYIDNFDIKIDKLKFPNGADINSIAIVNTSSKDGRVELVYNFLNDNNEVVTIKAVLTGLESEEDKELMSAEGVESILAK